MTFSGCPMANVCSFPLCPLSVERTAYPAARPSPIAAYWIDPELPLPPTARKRPFHAVTAGIPTPETTYVAASTVVPPILNVVEMPWQAVAGSVTTSREPGLFPPLLPHELSMGRVAHTANHTVAIVFIFGSWFQLNCRIARPYICVAGTDEVPQPLTSP